MKTLRSCLIAVSLCAPTTMLAQDKQQAAIEAVRELLPLVCGEFPRGGSSQQFEIKGNAEAKVEGLVKKLIDLGIQGATEFKSEEYVGVLRSEVGQEIKSVRQCNEKIYNDMKALIVEGNSSVHINNKGDNNTNIVGDGNSVNAK